MNIYTVNSELLENKTYVLVYVCDRGRLIGTRYKKTMHIFFVSLSTCYVLTIICGLQIKTPIHAATYVDLHIMCGVFYYRMVDMVEPRQTSC